MASKKKKKLGKGGKDMSGDLGLVPAVGQVQGTHGAEEEVDPNEPVYCTCQRVSYGQMVGCDNEECSFEWFHLDCVGLLAPPTGSWMCPDCCVEKGVIYQGAAVALPPPQISEPSVVAVAPMEMEQQKEHEQELELERSAKEAAAKVVEEGGLKEGGGKAKVGKEAALPVSAEEVLRVDQGDREQEGGEAVSHPSPAAASEKDTMS
eukprot:evm.model.NODE_188_length_14408_cov_22.127499.4